MKKIFILASVTFLSGAAMAQQSEVAAKAAFAKKPLAQQAAPVVQTTAAETVKSAEAVEVRATAEATAAFAAVDDQSSTTKKVAVKPTEVKTATTPAPVATVVKVITAPVPVKTDN